jgi:hypothetical protein
VSAHEVANRLVDKNQQLADALGDSPEAFTRKGRTYSKSEVARYVAVRLVNATVEFER